MFIFCNPSFAFSPFFLMFWIWEDQFLLASSNMLIIWKFDLEYAYKRYACIPSFLYL